MLRALALCVSISNVGFFLLFQNILSLREKQYQNTTATDKQQFQVSTFYKYTGLIVLRCIKQQLHNIYITHI